MSGGERGPDAWDPTRPLHGADAPRRRAPAEEAAEGEGAAGAGDGANPAGDPGGPAAAAPEDGGVLVPHLERLAALAARASALEEPAARYARRVERTLRRGGKLLLCGNGGSAATVEHVAAEYQVRFERERPGLPALPLPGSGAVASAAANDFSFEEGLARQVRALGRPGDLLVLHSTTGESENLVRAAEAARAADVGTVALLAGGGGRLADRVDLAIVVPTDETARAQELHLAVEHAVVSRVDRAFAADAPGDGDAPETGG